MPKKPINTKVLPDIDWKTKFRTSETSSDNVSISIVKGGKKMTPGTKLLSMVVRDNLFKQFGSDYVCFGIFKNRIYFRGTDKQSGYKVTVKGTHAYIQATLQAEEIANYEPFVGDYTLRYDEFYELYYIDIEREALDR